MKLKKVFALMCAVLLALTLIACDNIIDEHPDDVIHTDTPPEKADYPVDIGAESFDEAPLTVASLSPSITRAMYDLNVFDELIAVSDYCTSPSGAASLPKIGSAAHPDIEAIKALSPELVITHSPIASSDKVKLTQAGIRVLELDSPDSYAELCQMYIHLSLIFYGSIDSQDVAFSALSELDEAMTSAQALGINKSFVCIKGINGNGELILSHGETLESDILSVFGTNLRESETEFFVSEEDAKELKPDIVFYNSEIDDDEDASELIMEIFGDDVAYMPIDIAEFDAPTARLAETVNFLAAELA